MPSCRQPITETFATDPWVLHGEAVPAGEKLVSLFEPHAGIIVKASRGELEGLRERVTALTTAFPLYE